MAVDSMTTSYGIRTPSIRTTLLYLTTLSVLHTAAVAANQESNSAPSHRISNKSFFKLPAINIETKDRSKRDTVTYNVGTVVEYTTAEKESIQQENVTLRGQVSPEATNMEYMVGHF
jgi:hypothetical protein